MKSYSIIMPAFNEAANIEKSVNIVNDVFHVNDYELIIINDGSTDNTLEVISKLHGPIKVINNVINYGRGSAILQGYQEASKDYCLVIQAKADTTASEISKLIDFREDEDLTLTYQKNFHERPFLRRLVSRVFTVSVNMLFGANIKYYNGTSIIPTSLLKDLKIQNSSYSVDAEVILNLLSIGCTYRELAVVDVFEKGRHSRAFSVKNIIGVSLFFLRVVRLRLYKKVANSKQPS